MSVVGTPIKLVPSASAFRKNMSTEKVPMALARSGVAMNTGSVMGESASNKGMLGQVSDLIFGW